MKYMLEVPVGNNMKNGPRCVCVLGFYHNIDRAVHERVLIDIQMRDNESLN